MASFGKPFSEDGNLGRLGNITCRKCKETVSIEECDVLGACKGNVFCANCAAEIELSSGLPALLCGECDSCLEFMADGSFHQLQDMRLEQRYESLGYY